MDLTEENFNGNDKHYKMMRKAAAAADMRIWNEFCASMGPFFKADLRGIHLQGAVLRGALLVGARLDDACLDQADLTGADLTGATLTGASFREAILERAKITVPGKVKIRAKTTTQESTDPEIRRRQKIENQQTMAREFLKDQAKKAEALAQQQAAVKARNNPFPFETEDR